MLVDGAEKRLKQIVAEVAKQTGSILLETEAVPDHVHRLIDVDPHCGIDRVIKAMKRRSSGVLRHAFKWLKSRLPVLWTNSYVVATVGGAPLAVIKRDIENQKNV